MGTQPCAVVNLSLFDGNINIVKTACKNAKLCAVVKADAYGHGLVAIGREAEYYADMLAVGNVSEGAALRYGGIKKPILCLLPSDDYARAAFYDVALTVSDMKNFSKMLGYCEQSGNKLRFHLAVNTGMNRLGIDALQDLDKILLATDKCGLIALEGVFSHLYQPERNDVSLAQIEKFDRFAKIAKKYRGDIVCHILASGGLIGYPDCKYDMVRTGILIYGYAPYVGAISGELFGAFKRVEPIMKIYAKTIANRRVSEGDALLYGDYRCKTDAEISLLSYGYADGLRIGLNGQLNNACMNMCAVQKFDDYNGERFEAENILRSNGYVPIMTDAERTAQSNGFICYQTLVSASAIKNKIYVGGKTGYPIN